MSSPRCVLNSNGDFASSEAASGAAEGPMTTSTSLSMECAVDHIHLLLTGQSHEIDCVAGHANGQARVLFRMVHRIDQRFAVEDIHVHVKTGGSEVPVEDRRQVGD